MTARAATPAPPILFGTAGPPETTPKDTSVAGLREVARLGLDTMEIEFVQGVRMGEAGARAVDQTRSALNIPLSAHAPYFVNLASTDPKKISDSATRILDAARIGALCGADTVVFHPGYYMKRSPDAVFRLIRDNMKKIRKQLEREGLGHIILRPELTGKIAQFGGAEETFRLCRDVDGLLPCLDFSHAFARSLGACRSYDDFCRLLQSMSGIIGARALDSIHAHLSGIAFSRAGESRHLNMLDSRMDYKAVLRALKTFGAKGRVICESPGRGHDALLFKRYWKRYLSK